MIKIKKVQVEEILSDIRQLEGTVSSDLSLWYLPSRLKTLREKLEKLLEGEKEREVA